MVDSGEVAKRLAATIGAFAVVGFALGLTGYIGIDAAVELLMEGEGDAFGAAFVGVVFVQSVFITWFIGPVVALVTGVVNARDAEASVGALSSGVGSLVGFLAMAFLAVLLMASAFPETGAGGGGTTGPMSEQLGTMVVAALPTTFVGAIVGGLGPSFFKK